VKYKFDDIASESTIYELYLDLYFTTDAWIDAISDAISKAVNKESQVALETFSNNAAAGIRFQTTDANDIEKAKKASKKLIGLASSQPNSLAAD
jgi:hypothetical protein